MEEVEREHSKEALPQNQEGIYPELLSTGASVFDRLLRGGYEKDIVTTVYGPSGAGKTTVCLLAALAAVRTGKKVLFVDTEGGFSPIRLQQLAEGDTQLLERIFVLKPTTFADQIKSIEKLRAMISDEIGLIIIDTISMLYRIEMGRGEVKNVNSELGFQIAQLTEIARKKEIPILVTNQVYSDFDVPDGVKMVGGDLLKYGSKCLLELQKYKSVRRILVRKHRFLPENIGVNFKIAETGLEEYNG